MDGVIIARYFLGERKDGWMRSCGSPASMISWVCMNQVGRNDGIVKRRKFWILEAVGVKGTSTCVTSC